MNNTRKAWINGLFLAVTLAINALGAIGAINGLSQKQISDKYLTLITPSPSTFSIWGVIYSLLIISIFTMIIKNKTPYYQRAIGQLTVLFRLSCVLNIAWIVAFSYVQIELSVLFILGLVIVLSLICKQLLKIQENRRWLLPLSFGLYAGWLVIATVVNISAALVKLKWDGFGLSDETKAAWLKQDREKVGQIFNAAEKILHSFGLATNKIDELRKIALNHGALGFKFSGGGLGGIVIALCDNQAVANEIAQNSQKLISNYWIEEI